MTSPLFTRRRLLAAGALLSTAHLSYGAAPAAGDNRFVLIILRGGMDGLTAVPAPGDPAFAAARGTLAEFPTPALPLAGPFALHPALAQLHAMYGRGELAVLHAVGLPYRERSHFEAQQLLESGGQRPHELATGWLGRALGATHGKAIAMQTAVPLVLRGHAAVDTWAPSALPEPAPDLVARLERMYEGDADLARALQRARELRADGIGVPMMNNGMAGGQRTGPLLTLVKQAGEFLAKPGGPQVAVLDMGGWDSHANQGAPNGAIANNLRLLDSALATLRESLDASGQWPRTVVLVCTEFGREVAINGTQGTDHGSGGAAFMLGGAVAGGRVIADWPGLAAKERFEGRDLRITTDLRAAFKSVLHDHLKVASATIDRELLPGSGAVAALPLLKA